MTKTECQECGQFDESARCQRHEGWSNMETWGVALIIDNDRRTLNGALASVRVNSPDHVMLRSFVEGMANAGEPRMMQEQLIQCALSRVNWRELATHYIEKARDCPDCGGSVNVRLGNRDGTPGVCGAAFHS